MTFWEHLDELRKVLIRIAVSALLVMICAFVCKELLFKIVLAPNSPDFITYRLWNDVIQWFYGLFYDGISVGEIHYFDAISVQMISTNLTSQFVIHLRMALYAGLLIASPYMVFLLFGFISPGLYENEKHYVGQIAVWACVAFFVGLLLNYYVIFPFSLQFLGGYQVSGEVVNMFTLNSYVDTLVLLGLMMGIIFELPVVAWLLAELEVLNSKVIKKYRRHAIVIIVSIAAVITPTTDVFTLMLVSLPIYFLYELSIIVVGRVERKRIK